MIADCIATGFVRSELEQKRLNTCIGQFNMDTSNLIMIWLVPLSSNSDLK